MDFFAGSCKIMLMLKLKAEKRDPKDSLQYSREKGLLPAVFYGAKEESTPISIDFIEFKKLWKEAGESTVIELDTPKGELSVLIHEVALHPVSNEPVHIDFYTIEKGKLLEVSVPLEFVGISPAVKNLNGTLVKVIHELDIEVLPKDLPQNIEVDISSLETLDDVITVKDIKLLEGVKSRINEEEVVASVAAQKEEEEEPVVDVDMDSIEVEEKGKKDEEESTEEKTEEK